MRWRRDSPPGAVWREQAIAEIESREFTTDRLEAQIGGAAAKRIRDILEDAREAASSDGRGLGSRLRGSAIERAWGKINVADEALMQVAPDSYVEAQISRLRRRTEELPQSDERRKSLDAIAQAPQITPEAREELTAVLHSVNGEARKAQTRVRSFRNMILICAFVLGLTAAGLGVFGFAKPELIPVCFEPDAQVVCPTKVVALTPGAQVTGQPSTAQTAKENEAQDKLSREAVNGWDVLLIELLGTIAAALAAATALRKARGTSTPYGVPIALAVLKLPSGALTAVLGLLFIRGGFIPGLTALDTPAQILAWAIIFGYAQQLFTHMVDNQAHSVLQSAGSSVPLKSA
jgi:hypothetical protein